MREFGCALVSALLLLTTTAEGAKILVIFAFPGKSHVGAYQPLMEELARRGHEVTVVTAFPRKQPLTNYKEIIYEDTFPSRDSAGMNFFQMKNISFFSQFSFMKDLILESCGKMLRQPSIQQLIHSTDQHFDLIMYETFWTQCIYGFLHKFKAPHIQFIPNTLVSWITDTMGNPSTTSYIPDLMSQTEDMGIMSKVASLVKVTFMTLVGRFLVEPYMDSTMRENFPYPSIPSIHTLELNASFLFLHSHPFLHNPRPLTPNTIEVGGLHIKSNNKLPRNIQKSLDDATHGAIYFSLGSNVRSVDMPVEMRNAILRSFSKLKQKVLWKWEQDTLPGQPKNVQLGKWLPQNDILAHPNVKLFITHGGLMSLQEATYFGVPMITIPVGGDQTLNALLTQKRGYAVVMEVENITETSLDWALREVLEEPSYRENAKRASSIFRDQPQSPLDRAVFWTEYAIRHRGAPHLRSAALELNFFQYYLLDVIAALLLAVFTAVGCTVFVGRTVVRRLFFKPATLSKKKKRN